MPLSYPHTENNYYPFGLEHKQYNQYPSGNESSYQYKYQSQERQDELNLNWDSFKWRNYDYALGRFMSVDPLAEKYAYNSTYAFQENKMGLGRELEGLELERVRGGIEQFFGGVKDFIFNVTYGETNRQLETSQTRDIQRKNEIKLEGYDITMKASKNMAIGGTEVVKGTSKVTGESLQNIGDAGSAIAIATGQLECLPLTEGISTTGSLVNAAVDYSDGQPLGNIGLKLGVSQVNGQVSKTLVKGTRTVAGKEFVKAGKNNVTEAIVTGVVKTWDKLINYAIGDSNNTKSEQGKNKDKENR